MERLHYLHNVIWLIFLSLPIHKRRAERHSLELRFVLVEKRDVVFVLHTGNHVERNERNPRIAFAHKVFKRLFGCHVVAGTFVFGNVFNDDMACERRKNFGVGVSGLNCLRGRVDRFRALVFKGRAETQDNDSVFVSTALHFGIAVLEDANLSRHLQSGGRIFYLFVKLIGGVGVREK